MKRRWKAESRLISSVLSATERAERSKKKVNDIKVERYFGDTYNLSCFLSAPLRKDVERFERKKRKKDISPAGNYHSHLLAPSSRPIQTFTQIDI